MPVVAPAALPVPPVPVYETPARLPSSILMLSGSSDSDIPVAPDPCTRPLQPLLVNMLCLHRRHFTSTWSLDLAPGPTPDSFIGGSLASLTTPLPSSPVQYDASDMPRPVDSDDELVFMDVVVKLESSIRATLAPTARTTSKSKLSSASPRTRGGAFPDLGATAVAELGLANARPKKSIKPKPKSAKLSLTEQPASTSEPQRDVLPATKTKSSKRSSAEPLTMPGPGTKIATIVTIVTNITLQAFFPSPALFNLLEACFQSESTDLVVFVSTFPPDEAHKHCHASTGAAGSSRHWREIGQASYPEVLGLGEMLVKVVPLMMEAELRGK
ncbi:hypothetical protein BDV93DRAFT_545272 [Ceratobasidium sp. AG-I]|nr:hypothetical protein BDV93DRAFT_545272 [Ceratobasidium sp. AG-I]